MERNDGLETWKRAQNTQVVTLAEGRIIARLDDFQFDLESLRIYGWRLKAPGMFRKAGGIEAEVLTMVGEDVAFITTELAVAWTKGKAHNTKGRAWASQYRGTPAQTRRGKALGAVQDYVIDKGGNVVSGLVLHGGLLVPLGPGVVVGSRAVVVAGEELVVDFPEAESEDEAGWWHRLGDALRRGQGKQQEDADKAKG